MVLPGAKLGAVPGDANEFPLSRGGLHNFISKSKMTLSASPCLAVALSAARLRVLFDLEMK